jgi:type IV pilus assembly protein PilM
MAKAHGGAGRSLGARLKSGLNFSFGKGGAFIGLSIGASTVKLAELKKSKKNGWTLERYASVPLPQLASDQREILNPLAVTQAIQDVVGKSNANAREVCSALAGSGLIVKNLTLQITDMKELQDQVFWEAEQYIPFDISEVVIDFQITEKLRDGQVGVILIAVKKAFLEQYMSVIEEAKLVPKIMDAEFFALQNIFESNYPVSTTEATLLADIGALSTKIVICANGIPYFTKDSSFGGNVITAEIQRDLNLPSANDAEALKTSGNLPHEVSEIVARLAMVLGSELKKAVDYYTASSLGPPITHILISGGGARAHQLTRVIEESTRVPTSFLNSFQSITADPKKFSEDFLSSISTEAAIPMGLAIRAGSL